MDLRLYVVNGSHPCATVERALEMKGLAYKRVELPPPAHALIQRALFGGRTVPGLKLGASEKVQGSRAILRRPEELEPSPALLPADAAARARVEEAEAWGDDVLQPIGRRVLWTAMGRNPRAMPSFLEGSKLPLPPAAGVASAPLIVGIEKRLNAAREDAVRADLAALPGHFDRIDAWIADGVLGGEAPNAADLQIAPSIRLLSTLGDVRPLLEGRPTDTWARGLFPRWAGDIPAGALPPEWLP